MLLRAFRADDDALCWTVMDVAGVCGSRRLVVVGVIGVVVAIVVVWPLGCARGLRVVVCVRVCMWAGCLVVGWIGWLMRVVVGSGR